MPGTALAEEISMILLPEERDERRRQKDGEALLSRANMLDTLRASDVPAIANDASGQLVFWNRAAEVLFRRTAASALSTRCYAAVAGRDFFGNRYCSESCPVLDIARRQEQIRGFTLRAQTPDMPHEEELNVTILKLSGSRPDRFLLVHLLHPGRFSRPSPSVAEPRKPHAGNGHEREAPTFADGPADTRPLTSRETEVLTWVSAGLQNKEIAQELGISLATVRNHVHNILEKLTVHSKLEAVSLAFRRGWVTSSNVPPAPRSALPPAGMPRLELRAVNRGRSSGAR